MLRRQPLQHLRASPRHVPHVPERQHSLPIGPGRRPRDLRRRTPLGLSAHIAGLGAAPSATLLRMPENAPDEELLELSERTLAHYARSAGKFWDGTKSHDVTQNYEALLGAIEGPPPFTLLDFGCGPGRDLRYFQSLGHRAIGLEGC